MSELSKKSLNYKISSLCTLCFGRKSIIKRSKNNQKLCKKCFFNVFETEIHETIINNNLFKKGEKVAIGASGGKDSTVLAFILKTLNQRYNYGIFLTLISVDEGIKNYRDDSIATVKRNQEQYQMPLEIVSFKELYNWSMDEIVSCVGTRSSCTYCGVMRRQSLEKLAVQLDINHIVTGHNANDMAETLLMNLLRGDIRRIENSCSITTCSKDSQVKRSKPFKYAYQKDIVLYAHFKKLDYFSTECSYSKEAFRGTVRNLLNSLEYNDPLCILNIIYTGENIVLHEKKKNCDSLKGNDSNNNLKCENCGYLSSNRVCNACILLSSLKPKNS